MTHAIVRRAETLLELGRDQEALPLLHDALRVDPENLRALAVTARAYLGVEDLPSAMRYADAAVRVAPDQEWGHRIRSIVLLQQGKKKEALEAIDRAAALDPDNLLVLNQKFSVCRALKKFADACVVAQRMLELAPESTASHINTGLVHLQSKQYREAEAAFRRALQIDPESWTAMNNIAIALQGQKRHKEAVEYFYRAAQLNPSGSLPRNNLFQAAKRYLAAPVSFIAIATVIAAGHITDALKLNEDLATIVIWAAIALAVAIVVLARRARLRGLGEPLQKILTDHQRAERRKSTHRLLSIFMTLFTLVFWLPSLAAPFWMDDGGVAALLICSAIEAAAGFWWWRTRPRRTL